MNNFYFAVKFVHLFQAFLIAKGMPYALIYLEITEGTL